MRLLTTILLFLPLLLSAQSDADDRLSSLEFRNIGPHRGGRSCTVAGVPGKPNLYYFGAAGGGVWRTRDAGSTWENISDGYFGGSIGAVAVAASDPNVIYVGGGEKTVRGNVSYGYGVHKTIDGGKTWTHVGLANSRHIGRIRIDPRNADVAYAAVMGDLYKDTDERGVYKTTDGGKTWRKTLDSGARRAGAVEVVIDPTDPRTLFASTWAIRRTPYSLESGGPGSALWKSTDAGETWTDISANEGLPTGVWGISGVTVSPVSGKRVYALIENENGGVFVSDDGGETWTLRNESRALRQRAWYYTRIYADPADIDGVYVLNVNYHRSTDGGRTFTSHRAPHGDHHDLWIAPDNPDRMIIGDDGGAQISFDGGENWSTYHNQPTAQFYRVTTDNAFPYRIYAAQQDNSTIRIPHRTDGGTLGEADWEATAGGESAHLAPDPTDPEIVYGGSYGGYLTRYDHRTNQVRPINVWPDNPMGHGAEGMKYRFQWNFPIFFSPHATIERPDKPRGHALYTLSQHVHRSTDEGETWEIISPDLTRNEAEKLGSSGGPITQDNTSVEYYATLFAGVESTLEPGLIWVASDDGLVHLHRPSTTRTAPAAAPMLKWENVTPKNAPKYIMWNAIEVDTRDRGTAYLAGTAYKSGDYTPYLYRTRDYGTSWDRIDGGIPRDEFTRVIRQYPDAPNILFAGTEKGLYRSMDGGDSWTSFERNLPSVPITDMAVKGHNLIVATQGRSLWVLDDLTPLRGVDAARSSTTFYLYDPADAFRMGGSSRSSRTEGQNHPGGVNFHLWLSEAAARDTLSTTLKITHKGEEVRTWSSDDEDNKLELKPGGQTVNWDLHYPEGVKVPGMVLWWAGNSGPTALPGTYAVSLQRGDEIQTRSFDILADPRVTASAEDRQAQFDFMRAVQEKTSEAHRVIIDLRKVREQIKTFQSQLPEEGIPELRALGTAIVDDLTAVEEALYQTKNRSRQDPLNYPIRLTNKLAHLNSLNGIGTYRPTAASYAVKAELTAAIDAELAKYRRVVGEDVARYNQLILEARVPVISVPD